MRELEISEIKIDKLFVADLSWEGRNASIVRSIAALAQGFKIDLVAEGIESRDSCALLRHLGCGFGQGYGVGHPMPAEGLVEWCARGAFRLDGAAEALPPHGYSSGVIPTEKSTGQTSRVG